MKRRDRPGPLDRLVAMDRTELRFRVESEARKILGRARNSVRAPRWRRRAFAKLLVPGPGSPELAACRDAAAQGEWHEAHRSFAEHIVRRAAPFPWMPARAHTVTSRVAASFPSAAKAAKERADRVVAGRYDLLGYRDLAFGSPPRWHYDPVHDRTAPGGFWASVPYLAPESGDHKVIWEINRHQHFLALGRAYHLTGDRQYYATFVEHLEDWLGANRPLHGVNWASMLELSFRSLSWLWALHFFAPAVSGDAPGAPSWTVDLIAALDRQLDHIEQNLSRYFSPNTHLTGEALALYVAGMTLPELASSERRARAGRNVLLTEATRQVRSDGGHAELSAHYHRYSTDFYLLAYAVAHAGEDGRSHEFRATAERQAHYLRVVADDEGRLPLIGDDDGGQLFPICGRPSSDCRDTLAAAAVLLDRPDLLIDRAPEETFWLCGSRAPEGSLEVRRPFTPIPSASLPDSGYYVMRPRAGDRLIFDAGPHGFLNGGHAHADALSIVLTTGGEPLLVDPGTATYTMDPELRDRFRSTAMHNTVVVNGRPQSEPRGPFHWRSRADARAPIWRSGEGIDYVEGLHEGYAPIVHVRAILSVPAVGWVILDHVLGPGTATADAHWHLDPRWRVEQVTQNAVVLEHRNGRRTSIACSVPLDSIDGGLAVHAPEYGRVERAACLRARVDGPLPTTFATFVPAEARRVSIASVLISSAPPAGWHGAGFRLSFDGVEAELVCAVEQDGAVSGGASPGRPWGTESTLTDARVGFARASVPPVLINGRSLASSVHPALPGVAEMTR